MTSEKNKTMRKIWVIARREYQASIRSKAFLITMVLMPILMAGSLGLQLLFKKLEDVKDKHYAVLDRSGGQVANLLQLLAQEHNQHQIYKPDTHEQNSPRLLFDILPVELEDHDGIVRKRFEISQLIEHEKLDGLIEIGPQVLENRGDEQQSLEAVPENQSIRLQAKKPVPPSIRLWLEQALNLAIQRKRSSDAHIDPVAVQKIQQHVPVKYVALTQKTADGRLEDAKEKNQMAHFFLPALLIGLMFTVIMVGATPAMQGIVEEKIQRIAEVLLGSVRPFELMAGKLLGVIGVALTMTSVYLAGGYVVAIRYEVSELFTFPLIFWFFTYLVLALLIYGSIFIAVGAAANDIKDTQTLLTPIMLLATIPFFALGPIMQDPNGSVAIITSFIPFSTPMIMVARQSVPPGVPWWQSLLAIALVLATTFICVWSAGRIFRLGLLMQGKSPRMVDLVRWVLRG